MNKKIKYLFCLFIACVIIALGSLSAKADFGDFSGDSDYGSDGGGSYNSGSSYSGGSSYNNRKNYNSGSSYDDDDDDDYPTWVYLAIFAVIVIVLIIDANKKSRFTRRVTVDNATPLTNLKPMSDYLRLDPNFDEVQFREKLANWYVQLQNAWQKKDISSLRPYLTDDFYAQMEMQLQSDIEAHRTNIIDRIAVLSVQLKGYKQENGEDKIIAYLNTRIIDYTIDDNTGHVLYGNKNVEKFMTYEWLLTRTSGQLTGEQEAMQSVVCPHCGATLNINKTAKCDYCGSIITVEEHGFVISSIKGLSQRTGR
mgnify:FL=1